MNLDKLYETECLRDPADGTYDKILGDLPDLFAKKDGTRVTTKEEWKAHRQEMLTEMVDLCYGGMPPKPEVFLCRCLHGKTYNIIAGTKERTVSFELKLMMPPVEKEKYPVLLTGDDCWKDLSPVIVGKILERGFILAKFDRCMLADDVFSTARDFGVYPVYPEMKFGAISAWAWGYMRCVDALETMDFVDMDRIAIAGHSRGGKTTLLAGAWDERIKYVQSNASGMFGSGCFRYVQGEDPDNKIFNNTSSETMEHMLGYGVPWDPISFWFGPEMEQYKDREQDLPFDAHFLKAAVAPRWLLETGSVDDIWSNPRGSYVTYRAAKEAYKFLGIPERIACGYRYGSHGHWIEDFTNFLDFIAAAEEKKPYLWANADAIYGNLPKLYDWETPERQD